MPLFKMVNGERVQMSPQEEADFENSRVIPLAAQQATKRKEIRTFLRATDWTQLSDGPTGPEKAAWVQYRNSLKSLLKDQNLDPTVALPVPPGPVDES